MRRHWCILISFVAGAIVPGLQSFAATDDQSEYAVASQINRAHTGAIDFSGSFAPPLVRVWTTNLGEGVNSYPLVAKNTVFVIANGTDVFALDLSTGSQKWENKLDCCGGQGAYDNGRLFFLSSSGELTALSATTGDKLWNVQLTGETSFPAPPIAAKGAVFANGEGSNAIVYSVNEKDGSLLWSQDTTGAGLPSLADGALFLTSACFYYRLDPTDGSIIWTNEQCVGGSWESSAYANRRLYVPGIPTGNIVKATSGAVVGSYATWDYAPALFTDPKGKARGLSIDNDTYLTCWDAKTGKQLWEFPSSDGGEFRTPPVVVNGVVYAGTSFGTLYAVDSRNGKQLWSDDLGGFEPPILTAAQNTLVVSWSSEVIAYQPQSGGREVGEAAYITR